MHFTTNIINWYSVSKRELPWRNTKNPYNIWLSEIILQQTKIVQGLPYYTAFITRFPTIFDLAKATEEEVLKLWQGLGYYSRARNLHATAKHIVEEFNGVFPNTYKNLVPLKGIGDYTASAIASICFNQPCAVVDGNVYRVLSRYYGITTPIDTALGKKQFKKKAQEVLDVHNPAEFNQAIMEFGALQCIPKAPNCNACVLQTKCVAYQTNTITELPVKSKKTRVKNRYFNYLVFVSKDSKTILEKREQKGIWKNLYQFPLIETNSSLSKKSMLRKIAEVEEVQNKDYHVNLYNKEIITHKLSHQKLQVNFWIIKVQQLSNKAISIERLPKLPVPILIENFIKSFNF